MSWYVTDASGSVSQIVQAATGETVKAQGYQNGLATAAAGTYTPTPLLFDRFDFGGQWRFRADLGGNANIDLLLVSGGRFLRPGLGRTLSEDSSSALAGMPNPGLYANNSWPNRRKLPPPTFWDRLAGAIASGENGASGVLFGIRQLADEARGGLKDLQQAFHDRPKLPSWAWYVAPHLKGKKGVRMNYFTPKSFRIAFACPVS